MNTTEPLRVLLVEDQLLLARVVAALLGSEGMQVDIADNGRLAIERLHAATYDLVITDLMMPEMDGIQLLEWIRLEAALTVPVIALSANTDRTHTQRLQELGVLAVLKKPLDIDHFAATVTGLLNGPA